MSTSLGQCGYGGLEGKDKYENRAGLLDILDVIRNSGIFMWVEC